MPWFLRIGALSLVLSVALGACSGGDDAVSSAPAWATQPMPPDGLTDVSTEAQLSWSPTADAVEYEVYLDDNPNFTATDRVAATSATEAEPGILRSGKTYFWRVDALDGTGGVVPSEVFQFTTASLAGDDLLNHSAAGILASSGHSGPVTSIRLVQGSTSAFVDVTTLLDPCSLYGGYFIYVESLEHPAPTGGMRTYHEDAYWYAGSGSMDWDGGSSYTGTADLVFTHPQGPSSPIHVAFNIDVNRETSTFELAGDVARLAGTLGPRSVEQLQVLADDHPEIRWIEFGCVQGAVDDAATRAAGQILRDAGFGTRAPAGSDVTGGGVELFTAGVVRTIEEGANFRVHAWEDEDGNSATLFQPCPGHPAHAERVAYLNQMMGAPAGEEFYCFAIKACEPDCTYTMTPGEIEQFGLATPAETGADPGAMIPPSGR